MSAIGGFILLISGVLFLVVLIRGQRGARARGGRLPLQRRRRILPARMPVALNSFALWLALMIGLTVVNYGYPIAQLMVLKETSVPAVYVGAQPMSDAAAVLVPQSLVQRQRRRRRPASPCSPRSPASSGCRSRSRTSSSSGIWDAICSAAGVPRASSQARRRSAGLQDLECRDDVGDADAARARSRSAAAPRWRSAARSATGRRASATPIRPISPGNSPP